MLRRRRDGAAMTERAERCGKCRFWSGDPDSETGDCRRRAPVWAETKNRHWCGEFEAREVDGAPTKLETADLHSYTITFAVTNAERVGMEHTALQYDETLSDFVKGAAMSRVDELS